MPNSSSSSGNKKCCYTARSFPCGHLVRHYDHPYLKHSPKCSIPNSDRQCQNAQVTITRPFTKFNCNYCQKTENERTACVEALVHHPDLQEDQNIEYIMKRWILPYLDRSFVLKEFLIILHNTLHAEGSIKIPSTHPGAAHNMVVDNGVERAAPAAVSIFKQFAAIIPDTSDKGKKDAAAIFQKTAAAGGEKEGKIAASIIEKAAIEKVVAEELAKDREWENVVAVDHADGEMVEDDWMMVKNSCS